MNILIRKQNKWRQYYYEIRFLDTIAFMNTSIQKLVKNLSDSCESIQRLRETFKYTSEHFTNDEQF